MSTIFLFFYKNMRKLFRAEMRLKIVKNFVRNSRAVSWYDRKGNRKNRVFCDEMICLCYNEKKIRGRDIWNSSIFWFVTTIRAS